MNEISASEKKIYFITGASGVGKTTLVSELSKKYKNKTWSFLHFDQSGVPLLAEMSKEFGSPSNWQKAKAFEWINKLVHNYPNERIFFEGQVNLEFIRRGFEKENFKNYVIILLDCSEDVMAKRLVRDRNQPELFNADMRIWLKFLRNQAKEFGAFRIDTSELSKSELVSVFEDAVDLKS